MKTFLSSLSHDLRALPYINHRRLWDTSKKDLNFFSFRNFVAIRALSKCIHARHYASRPKSPCFFRNPKIDRNRDLNISKKKIVNNINRFVAYVLLNKKYNQHQVIFFQIEATLYKLTTEEDVFCYSDNLRTIGTVVREVRLSGVQ